MKKITKKKFALMLVFLFVVSASLAAYYMISQNKLQNQNSQTSYAVKPTPITYENIENILSGNDMIKILPENSVILLKFYNFNGSRVLWEKSYVLKKGLVKEGTAVNPDITLSMHSKYFNELTDQNLCSTMKKAKNNNDLGTEIHISYAALLWKYKSALKYRDCFGL